MTDHRRHAGFGDCNGFECRKCKLGIVSKHGGVTCKFCHQPAILQPPHERGGLPGMTVLYCCQSCHEHWSQHEGKMNAMQKCSCGELTMPAALASGNRVALWIAQSGKRKEPTADPLERQRELRRAREREQRGDRVPERGDRVPERVPLRQSREAVPVVNGRDRERDRALVAPAGGNGIDMAGIVRKYGNDWRRLFGTEPWFTPALAAQMCAYVDLVPPHIAERRVQEHLAPPPPPARPVASLSRHAAPLYHHAAPLRHHADHLPRHTTAAPPQRRIVTLVQAPAPAQAKFRREADRSLSPVHSASPSPVQSRSPSPAPQSPPEEDDDASLDEVEEGELEEEMEEVRKDERVEVACGREPAACEREQEALDCQAAEQCPMEEQESPREVKMAPPLPSYGPCNFCGTVVLCSTLMPHSCTVGKHDRRPACIRCVEIVFGQSRPGFTTHCLQCKGLI